MNPILSVLLSILVGAGGLVLFAGTCYLVGALGSLVVPWLSPDQDVPNDIGNRSVFGFFVMAGLYLVVVFLYALGFLLRFGL